MAFVTQLSAYALQGDFMDSVDLRIVLPSYSLRFLLLLHFVFLIHQCFYFTATDFMLLWFFCFFF